MHSHFLWLNSPHSGSAPSLINQDAYSLVQWDEQSAWQAGSYSFLTPASTEWCNRTAGSLPFLLFFLCFPLPYIYSPFLALSCFLFPPSLLFPAQSPSPSTTPSSHTHLHTYIHWRCLTPSLSLSCPKSPVSQLVFHTITPIHQLSAYSLATPLPTLFRIMTTTPSILHTPFPHLPPLWPVKCDSPHTFFPSPFPSLSSPKLTGL